jgi:hypothetical protein
MSRRQIAAMLAAAGLSLSAAPAALAGPSSVGSSAGTPTANICVSSFECTYVNYRHGKPTDVVNRAGTLVDWSVNAGSTGGQVLHGRRPSGHVRPLLRRPDRRRRRRQAQPGLAAAAPAAQRARQALSPLASIATEPLGGEGLRPLLDTVRSVVKLDRSARAAEIAGKIFSRREVRERRGMQPMEGQLERGSVIGGYRIDELISRGGMGVVYRATTVALNRIYALKVLAPALADDDQYRERFKREMRTCSAR